MKYIEKKGPPEPFQRCLQKHSTMNWDTFCRQEFASVKTLLANALRQEQGYLCCYCEEEIARGVSHIEHFRPKSLYPQHDLNYYNLLASCNGCGKKEDASCGVRKRNLFFETLINPTDSSCESRFLYTADGQILPVDENDEDAWQTIAVLGLNGPKLRRRREMIFQELGNLRELLPEEDFQKYIRIRLERSPQGRFCEFWTTVRYFTQEI